MTTTTCPRCHGTGRVLPFGACLRCQGRGSIAIKPQPYWAIFGADGLRLCSAQAGSRSQAIERAQSVGLEAATIRVIRWSAMADPQAVTWSAATGAREAA